MEFFLTQLYSFFSLETHYSLIYVLSSIYLITILKRSYSFFKLRDILFPRNHAYRKELYLSILLFFPNKLFEILFVLIQPILYFYLVKIFLFSFVLVFGQNNIITANNPILIKSIYAVILILLTDFTIYFIHKLFHENKYLWQFHKIHHSARTLNFFSVNRVHPVENIIIKISTNLSTAFLLTTFFYIFQQPLNLNILVDATIIQILFRFAGVHLRHSHIWLTFPNIFKYIFISPSLHQIHHSKAKRHLNKNYGTIFTFWDYLFKTLYIPKKKERLAFGLYKESDKPYEKISNIYLLPLIYIKNKIKTRLCLEKSN